MEGAGIVKMETGTDTVESHPWLFDWVTVNVPLLALVQLINTDDWLAEPTIIPPPDKLQL